MAECLFTVPARKLFAKQFRPMQTVFILALRSAAITFVSVSCLCLC